ncbi:hypothetical protein DMI70_20560 [Escherichia coli]|nr:hypothetical protein [Escherichia coli]
MRFVHAGCGVNALSGLQTDNVRFVRAGCGVNALSGLQNICKFNTLRVGLISVAHQAVLRLSSVSCPERSGIFPNTVFIP